MKAKSDRGGAATTPKTCFSYIRFSSGKQKAGSSEERQLGIAPRVAAQKGWILDQTLNASDLGFSAYHKANLAKGAGLATVIEAALNGKILSGAVCIIEALDRLQRCPLDDSYQLLRKILLSGLELYIDRSGRHLTKADLNNAYSLMMTAVELDAAYEHSAKLADRVGKAWKKKRETLEAGKKITKKVPAWVDPETWKPIPTKAATVRKIFQLYANGYGITSIVRRFNHDGVNPLTKAEWCAGNVQRILHSRQVIGEYQPCVIKHSENGRYHRQVKAADPVPNYYPRVIEDDLFFRVQAKFNTNRGKRKTDAIRNLFAGVSFCTCGNKMAVVPGRSKQYFTCYGKIKATGCKEPLMRYDKIEKEFAMLFHSFPDELAKDDNSASVKLDVLNGKAIDLQKQIDRITEAVISGTATKALTLKQAQLEKELEETTAQIELCSGQASNGEQAQEQIDRILENIANLQTDKTLRITVRDWVLTNVDRMTFYGTKSIMEIRFKGTETPISWELEPDVDHNPEYYAGVS